jgi:hypothetical protein
MMGHFCIKCPSNEKIKFHYLTIQQQYLQAMEELNGKQIKKKKPESQIVHETSIIIISGKIQREICFLTSIGKSQVEEQQQKLRRKLDLLAAIKVQLSW